jgi:hypothetical protein
MALLLSYSGCTLRRLLRGVSFGGKTSNNALVGLFRLHP